MKGSGTMPTKTINWERYYKYSEAIQDQITQRRQNTPSGTGRTALDKFVMHYTAQGYEYETDNNDFIFRKPGSVLFAEAVISPETGHITGYNVRRETI
jgi:hypothetical protein